MIPQLTQETVNEYASEALTIQEPQGADYTRGVSVGKTIPAKWWNWLFNAVTKRVSQSKSDAQSMFNELKNVVTDAGLTPSGADNTQLTQAVDIKAQNMIDEFIIDKRGYFVRWVQQDSQPFPTLPSGYLVASMFYTQPNIFIKAAYYRTSASQVRNKVYVSFMGEDMIWTKPLEVTTVNDYEMTYPGNFCDIVRFNGMYYFTISCPYGPDGGGFARHCESFLYCSADLNTWTLLDSYNFDCPSYNAADFGPALAVVEDTLWLYAPNGNYSTRQSFKKTTDGVTWQSIQVGYDFDALDILTDNSTSNNRTRQFRAYKYGSNGGFVWGSLKFDGTTFSKLSSELATHLDLNLLFTYSDRVLYVNDSHLFATSALGQSFTEITTYGLVSTIVITSNKQRIFIAGSGGWYIANDADFVFSPFLDFEGQQCTGRLFEKNGYIYNKRHRTADLVHWEDIPNLPDNYADGYVQDTIDPNVIWYCGDLNTNYITTDLGLHWKRVMYSYDDISQCRFTYCCFSNGYPVTVTYNNINYVSGNTLYLR